MKEKYLRMLKKMEEKSACAAQAADWSVYIILCADGSLYTGVAKDADARFEQHRRGRGAAYTRSHPPLRMVHREDGYTRSAALSREAAIKRLPKAKKLALAGDNERGAAKDLCETKKSKRRKS